MNVSIMITINLVEVNLMVISWSQISRRLLIELTQRQPIYKNRFTISETTL